MGISFFKIDWKRGEGRREIRAEGSFLDFILMFLNFFFYGQRKRLTFIVSSTLKVDCKVRRLEEFSERREFFIILQNWISRNRQKGFSLCALSRVEVVVRRYFLLSGRCLLGVVFIWFLWNCTYFRNKLFLYFVFIELGFFIGFRDGGYFIFFMVFGLELGI